MIREFEGIVIKFSKYLDNDAMITVLTKTGIKSFLARGALKMKSKNAHSLNLYTISKFELLEEKYGNILKTGVSIYVPFNLYSSFESLACLSLIGEATFNSINEYDEYYLFISNLFFGYLNFLLIINKFLLQFLQKFLYRFDLF